MKRMYWIFALLLTSMVAVSCDDDTDGDNDAKFSDNDRSFVENAAKANMYEIELGEVAVAQGRDSLVRAYAQMMIDEHTAAQDELKEIADKESSVNWPTELADVDKASRDSIVMLQGFSFDSLYMAGQVNIHDRTTTMYDNISRTSRHAETKAYAGKYLDAIQHHREVADSIVNVIPQRWQNDQGEVEGLD